MATVSLPPRVVLDQDALFVTAVDISGNEVQPLAFSCLEEGEVADAGYLAAIADRIGRPEGADFREGVARVEEAVDAF